MVRILKLNRRSLPALHRGILPGFRAGARRCRGSAAVPQGEQRHRYWRRRRPGRSGSRSRAERPGPGGGSARPGGTSCSSVCHTTIVGWCLGLGLGSRGFGLAVGGFGLAVGGFGLAVRGFGLAVRGFGLAVGGFGLVVRGFGCSPGRGWCLWCRPGVVPAGVLRPPGAGPPVRRPTAACPPAVWASPWATATRSRPNLPRPVPPRTRCRHRPGQRRSRRFRPGEPGEPGDIRGPAQHEALPRHYPAPEVEYARRPAAEPRA